MTFQSRFLRMAYVLCATLVLAGCLDVVWAGLDGAGTLGKPPIVVPYAPIGPLQCETEPSPSQDVVLIDGAGQFPVAARIGDSTATAVFRGRGTHVSLDGRLDFGFFNTRLGIAQRLSPSALDSPLDDRNPALFAHSGAQWVVAYSELNPGGSNGAFDPERATFRLRVSSTSDSGRTWSTPTTPSIAPLDTLLTIPYGKMLKLDDGTLLMSVYTGQGSLSNYPSWRPAILVSHDDGQTWSTYSLLPRDHYETAIVRLRGDTLFAIMRAGLNFLSSTMSFDRGRSWLSPTPVTAVNQVPGDLVVLSNGEILMVYGARAIPKGINYRRIRQEGARLSFSAARPAAAVDIAGIDFGYPSVLGVLPDDRVAILYYITDGASTSLHFAVICPSASP